MDLLTALFAAAAFLYGLAAVAYMAFLLGAPARTVTVARALMGLAFLGHMAEIGARGVSGMHPVSSTGDAVGFLAWIMVAAFLIAEWQKRLDAVGAFVAPAALVLLIAGYLSPDESSTAGLGVLGRVHIGLAIVGVSAFALASGLATFYLLNDHQLKRRKVGNLVKRGAALETLDRLAYRFVLVGFPVFSAAMVTGAIWSSKRGGVMKPEYPFALLAWTAFAALLAMRHTLGWRGRRAAWLTITGFAAAVVVLGLYLARQLAEG
jgi:ABC-type uncharacterized transport system permease subunit